MVQVGLKHVARLARDGILTEDGAWGANHTRPGLYSSLPLSLPSVEDKSMMKDL